MPFKQITPLFCVLKVCCLLQIQVEAVCMHAQLGLHCNVLVNVHFLVCTLHNTDFSLKCSPHRVVGLYDRVIYWDEAYGAYLYGYDPGKHFLLSK